MNDAISLMTKGNYFIRNFSFMICTQRVGVGIEKTKNLGLLT